MATQLDVDDEEEQDEMEFADWTQGSRSARKPGKAGNWRDELSQRVKGLGREQFRRRQSGSGKGCEGAVAD